MEEKKKKYVTPELEVMEMNMQMILCGSGYEGGEMGLAPLPEEHLA